MNKKRILIIERDTEQLEGLEASLTVQGYIVVSGTTGAEALALQAAHQPDLVLIDANVPDYDGLDLCRQMSVIDNTPIIIMAEDPGPVDRILMLEMGADDFLAKPFNQRELLARIKALFRRIRLTKEKMEANRYTAEPKTSHPVLNFGNLAIDERRHEVTLNKQPLRLRPQEYELLLFFARHRGITVSRDTIFDRVWQRSDASSSRTVDVHVRWLRQKIEADPKQAQRIVSVRVSVIGSTGRVR